MNAQEELFYETSYGRLAMISNKGSVIFRDATEISGWREATKEDFWEKKDGNETLTYARYDCYNPNSPVICLEHEASNIKGEGIPNPMLVWIDSKGNRLMKYSDLVESDDWKKIEYEVLNRKAFATGSDQLIEGGNEKGYVEEIWANSNGQLAEVVVKVGKERKPVSVMLMKIGAKKDTTQTGNVSFKACATLSRRYWHAKSDAIMRKKQKKGSSNNLKNITFNPAEVVAELFGLPKSADTSGSYTLEHLNKDYKDCSINNLWLIPNRMNDVMIGMSRLYMRDPKAFIQLMERYGKMTFKEIKKLEEKSKL